MTPCLARDLRAGFAGSFLPGDKVIVPIAGKGWAPQPAMDPFRRGLCLSICNGHALVKCECEEPGREYLWFPLHLVRGLT